ncbi:MAG: hypothetical protein MPK30_09135 [Gammaproteobacteria bacterium]|nr:hypothetical protein [Gammaproteobacteria bacterium]
MQDAALKARYIRAVRESHREYKKHGARSSRKLRPLHQWVADEIVRALGAGYETESLRKDSGREKIIAGKYYDKRVDVSISKKGGKPLAVISIKFVDSNFKQNANNYFELLMGETANIRRAGVRVGHLMVLPAEIPYKNKAGETLCIEKIRDADLQKYVKLSGDANHPHRPDAIGIGIVSLHKNLSQIRPADLRKTNLSRDVKSALAGKLSVPSFFRQMKRITRTKA